MPIIFPDETSVNRVIGVSASESRSGFSVIITDCIVSLHAVDMVGGQYFPLFVYDDEGDKISKADDNDMFANRRTGSPIRKRRDGITDSGLTHFQSAYSSETLKKEDIFYYVYGLLHSPDYRTRYADNLGKELPRIPCVKTTADFWTFSKSGRDLAALHLNYETIEPHPATLDTGKNRLTALTDSDYRVTKMKFAVKGDKSTVIYNPHITIRNIPTEAYEYVVNGKPALEWVMERQSVTTDKDSGIVNDANLWATETMNNARYPLDLFLRVITVSLRTQEIIKKLPALDI